MRDTVLATATQALWRLLDSEAGKVVAGTRVVCVTPDRAREVASERCLNLFLFHVAEDAARKAAWTDRFGQQPPTLNLHYLVTAYGPDDPGSDQIAHTLLGCAIRTLEENPVITVSGGATSASLRLHVVLDSLGVEEMSRLWAMFQTPYRLSVAYEVRVAVLPEADIK